jgi:hypothetical protein
MDASWPNFLRDGGATSRLRSLDEDRVILLDSDVVDRHRIR